MSKFEYTTGRAHFKSWSEKYGEFNMVLTPSTMPKLGTIAPPFSLQDSVSGRTISIDDFRDKKGLLVMFICRHCPYVQHIKVELGRVGSEYLSRGLGIVAISSNDAKGYPDDAPEKLKEMAKEEGYQFPFLYDETQAIAKAYGAACTPDFFLYDAKQALFYRGQLDESRPGNGKPLTGKDLREAIETLLSGKAAPKDQKPSIGCNIKWKPGNEPAYFSS